MSNIWCFFLSFCGDCRYEIRTESVFKADGYSKLYMILVMIITFLLKMLGTTQITKHFWNYMNTGYTFMHNYVRKYIEFFINLSIISLNS